MTVGQWWCCLNPVERNITIALNTVFILSLGYITVEDYEALWELVTASSRLKRRDAYQHHYALAPSTITDIEGNVTEVYLFGTATWLEISVYIFDEGTACSGRCVLLAFSDV